MAEHADKRPLKVLIAGLGSIGQRHLRNLRALTPLEVISHRRRGLPLAEDLRDLPLVTCASLEEALAHRPKAALVCSPPALQLGVARAAVDAGCHLFVEKPIAPALDGLDDLLAAARTRGVATLVGYNMRFHPQLRRIRGWLEAGRIGRVCSLRAEVGQWLPDWHPWEDYRRMYSARRALGGGVVLDLIHELDYVRWLFGPVTEVRAWAGRTSSLEIDTEDTAEIVLRFAGGAVGSVHLDYVQRAPARGCRIVGEEGTIVWDFFADELRLFEAARGEWRVERLEDYERNAMYRDEMAHFLALIAGRERSAVDLAEGIESLRLALAVKEASEGGRAVALA